MNRTAIGQGQSNEGTGWKPAGRFLDDLPQALYVMAHIAMLAGGIALGLRANNDSLPFSGALALYVASQVGFLAYFAKAITMKMAVLMEQMLVFAMLVLIVLRAS